MRLRNNAPVVPVTPAQMPRDVEALEKVIEALGTGADTELQAHRTVLETIVSATAMAFGGVWCPSAAGSTCCRPRPDRWPRRWPRGGRPTRCSPRPPASAARPCVSAGRSSWRSPPKPGRCLRWETAVAAGARQGSFVPIVEDDRVVAVVEVYTTDQLPFLGPRRDKWKAILRVAAHARHSALATAALQETLNDRVAVTTVVTEMGAARNQDQALRIALNTVRDAFGWAYGRTGRSTSRPTCCGSSRSPARRVRSSAR
jgi:hypothetical protein